MTKFARRGDETLSFSLEIKTDDVNVDGHFKGYASTFGGPADSGGDVIATGCFAKTLKSNGRNGNGIALLWSHDARAPIGIWTSLQEDKKGLYVEGCVEPTAMPDGIPVHKIMRMGGIKGLSIGYSTVLSDMDEKKRVRTIKEAELWEISLVTFPMNTRASVTSVKEILGAKTPRELERSLRDAGIDHEVSKYLVALCKSGLRDAGRQQHIDSGQDWQAVLDELKKANAAIKI